MSAPIILLIEPNCHQRESFHSILHKHGYETIEMEGFDFSFSTLAGLATGISLVLVNLKLPGNSGIDLIKSAQEHGLTAPFIGYTLGENMDLARECMRVGGFSYFTLPFSQEEFLFMVRQAVDEAGIFDRLRILATRHYEQLTPSQVQTRLSVAKQLMAQRQAKGRVMRYQELLSLLTSSEDPNNKFSDQYSSQLRQQGFEIPEEDPQETLIVVEDEPLHRENLKLVLGPYYHLVFAEDCEQAINAFEAYENVDLILLDIMLPDGQGLDLISVAKGYHPQAEVVMITGYDLSHLVVSSFRAGAFDYICKPFRRSELMFTLAKALHRRYLRTAIANMEGLISIELPAKMREEMAKKAYQKKLRDKEPFTVKDLSHFFPELESTRISYDTVLSNEDVEDGLQLFVQMHKGT